MTYQRLLENWQIAIALINDLFKELHLDIELDINCQDNQNVRLYHLPVGNQAVYWIEKENDRPLITLEWEKYRYDLVCGNQYGFLVNENRIVCRSKETILIIDNYPELRFSNHGWLIYCKEFNLIET